MLFIEVTVGDSQDIENYFLHIGESREPRFNEVLLALWRKAPDGMIRAQIVVFGNRRHRSPLLFLHRVSRPCDRHSLPYRQ